MPRLPQVGGDAGNWGDVLNEYLTQSLDTTGNVKAGTVGTVQLVDASVTNAKIATGTIAEDKLSSAVQTKLNTTTGVADGSITTAKLADDAVTDDKIATATIAEDKLSTGVQTKLNAPTTLTDSSVTTAKLADDAVTDDKIATATIAEDKLSSAVQTKLNAAATIADGSISTAKLADDSVTSDKIDNYGEADGVATLDGDGKVPEAQLPARLSAATLSTTIIDTLVAGDNVTLTPNVGDGTVTINATASEPGGSDGKEVRSATTSSYSYMGTAPVETAENATGWSITRITLSSPPVVQTSTGSWDNRGSLTYT